MTVLSPESLAHRRATAAQRREFDAQLKREIREIHDVFGHLREEREDDR